MNIRMQSERVNTTGASRPPETIPAVGVERRDGKTAVTSADSINLSSLASQIAHANQLAEARQNARVDALASLYSRGEFNVDSLDLSRSVIAHSVRDAGEDNL